MAYGEPNQADGSFRGPGKGTQPHDYPLSPQLQRARVRNTVVLAQMRSKDPIKRAVLQQQVEDLTFAHTGQTLQEEHAAWDDYYTRMIHADVHLGSVALDGWD